jgi:Concanavalin A-like lectin/glucanases superfamily
MEKLKFTKLSSLLLIMAIAGMVVLNGCKEDPVVAPTPADFTALVNKIVEAESLIATTTEGTDVGEYEIGAKVELQKVIGDAKVVVASETTDQSAVDNTVIALQAAIDTYGTKLIEAIDPATLVGYWKFDEGVGTRIADASGNNFDGIFDIGRVNWGAGEPVWADDRNGNAGKAIAFDNGAWIKVPYNTAINPAQMTISIWVNAAVIDANNRFLGLRSWLGFKFQLQSANKAFFTAAMSPEHTGDIWDRDTDPVLNTNQWYHLVVSTGGGEMVFYINGTETRRWTDTPGDLATVTDHDLAIGVGSSRYADTDVNYGDVNHADYHVIPEAWGGYFRGSLDELRIYNTVLTGPQVKSIYDDEK